MISSFYSVSEEMEIQICPLNDRAFFLGQDTHTSQPPAGSSTSIEASISLGAIDGSSTCSAPRFSAEVRSEPEVVSFHNRSTAIAEKKRAGRILFVNRAPPIPVLDEVTATKKDATFDNLDQEVQLKIFEHVLSRGNYHPYYCRGMLADGPWSAGCVDGEMDIDVVHSENVDLSLLQVNKNFNKVCSEIFYGQNHFVFHRADVCRWWTQHIGLKNFSCVQSLGLSLGSGFYHDGVDQRGPLELSQEEMWLGVLHWMKNRHCLQHLHVHLDEWHGLKGDSSLTRKEKEEAHYNRLAISDLLQRFRGIQTVKITTHRSRWFTSYEKEQLSLLMQQQKEPVIPRPKELCLLKLLDMIRLEREDKEQEYLRERRQRMKRSRLIRQDFF